MLFYTLCKVETGYKPPPLWSRKHFTFVVPKDKSCTMNRQP